MDQDLLRKIVEGALLAAGRPLNERQLLDLFHEGEPRPGREELQAALEDIQSSLADRGFELKKVASGYRFQVRQELSEWMARLWEEKPQKYSRAVLETLALIAYRQPITRGEIEEIRGVAVSTNIIRTLQERDWVRVVGHREVPGRPAMYATTRTFLDYFNLTSLDQLPPLAEIREIDNLSGELQLEELMASAARVTNPGAGAEEVTAEAAPGEAEHASEFSERPSAPPRLVVVSSRELNADGDRESVDNADARADSGDDDPDPSPRQAGHE